MRSSNVPLRGFILRMCANRGVCSPSWSSVKSKSLSPPPFPSAASGFPSVVRPIAVAAASTVPPDEAESSRICASQPSTSCRSRSTTWNEPSCIQSGGTGRPASG